MKVRFCHNCTEEFIAEVEVARDPTPVEIENIYCDIEDMMSAWEKKHGDFEGFNFEEICLIIAKKHLEILEKPQIRTIYV